MFIYWIIFIFLALLALDEKRISVNNFRNNYVLLEKRNYSYYFIFFLGLVIVGMSGIRWEVGTDWDAFYSDFNYFKSTSWNGIKHSVYGMTYERGYVILTYLFARYIGNYSLYLTFQSILIMLCIFPVIYKYSEYPFLSFLGFFSYSFCNCFAVARSGIAMAICFRAFDALLNNEKKKYFLLSVLAVFFHNTAFVFLILPLLDKIHLTDISLLFLLLFSLVVSFFSMQILMLFASLAGLPDSISIRLMKYLTETEDYGAVSGIFRIITRGFVVLLMYVCLWKQRENRKINLIVNMYILSIIIYISVSRISVTFMRMSYYFEDISQFIMFAECIASLKNKYKRSYYRLILVLFFGFKLFSRVTGTNFVVPYKTILF